MKIYNLDDSEEYIFNLYNIISLNNQLTINKYHVLLKAMIILIVSKRL